MGRQPPADHMEASDACRQLGVTRHTLNGFVKKGLLSPRVLEGHREIFFTKHDVDALELALAEAEADPQKAVMMALVAMSSARRTERLVEQLFESLGLDIAPIDRNPSAIRSVYLDAKKGGLVDQVNNPDWVRYWGRLFFAMDETYLELVGQQMGDDEPWKTFLDFAGAVILATARSEGEAFARARKVLVGGRDHLRYVGYMLCRKNYGRRTADKIFDGRVGAVNEILTILS